MCYSFLLSPSPSCSPKSLLFPSEQHWKNTCHYESLSSVSIVMSPFCISDFINTAISVWLAKGLSVLIISLKNCLHISLINCIGFLFLFHLFQHGLHYLFIHFSSLLVLAWSKFIQKCKIKLLIWDIFSYFLNFYDFYFMKYFYFKKSILPVRI